MRRHTTSDRGFTLVEMIVVIVITGIIGGMVAVFIRAPVQGYIDSERRAELTDMADTAFRRIARDVRTAVPNSVRITSTSIEFIPTRDGGRYRAASSSTGNPLVFGTSGTQTFDVIGTPPSFLSTDYIVVGSTQSGGTLPYDETAAGVLRTYVSGTQTVTFSSHTFPASAELSSQRFDVVDGTQKAVTYACETDPAAVSGDGPMRLMRYWLYWSGSGIVHPTYTTGVSSSSAILATKLSNCAVTYSTANQRFGLLAIQLTLLSSGESVTLYNEIHVNNMP